MLKWGLLQLHWLLGVTAGIILALVGVTGGILSFETELLRLLNPGVMTVEADAPPLPVPDLLARVAEAAPDATVLTLTVSADPAEAAGVRFAAPDGGPRGVQRYVDPATGALLGEPDGVGFFRFVRQLHRNLVAGDVGRQLVAASTVLLIVLSLTGLCLRWPRRPLAWRSWFHIDLRRRGRSLMWALHSVTGTWLLVPYVVMAATGLYYSYDWYRDWLHGLAGVGRPVFGGPQQGGAPREEPAEGADAGPVDIAAVWAAFTAEVAGFSTATLRLPESAARPVDISYLDPDPAHERATNTLSIDPQSLAVVAHRRYDNLATGEQLMRSIFPLHSGSYFGVGGLVLFMVASLLMPLFAITGWLLYLDRRRRRRDARREATRLTSSASAPAAASGEPVLVGFASQSGTAERLAWQTAAALAAGGVAATVEPLARLDAGRLASFRRALFVVSTFGDGEPPDAARGFFRRTMRAPASLQGLSYGLLALGDRSYARFCGFGRALDGWLRHGGATPLFAPVELDGTPDAGLGEWRSQLGAIAGAAAAGAGWQAPAFRRWTLVERRLLNPGSLGGPCFHIRLSPPDAVAARWQAGDIAEIRVGGTEADPVIREYSIASLPADGTLDLVVRRVRKADGRDGLGSGLLTRDLLEGEGIALRIRENPGFRQASAEVPLVLIGNGTGIAGLRAHWRARAATGGRMWLLFGERSAATDSYFADEVEALRCRGRFARVDRVFSRDQAERLHVQHRLRDAAHDLRAWVAEGAVILVCGSREGMAPGVDAALRAILGDAALDALAEAGRYRRDVY